MSVTVVLRPQAAAEVLEVRRWYDERPRGLGDAFAGEVDGLLSRLIERPWSFPRVRGKTRGNLST